MIANLREPAELYAEEIPLEETNLTDDAKVIDVFHYHREPTRYFGVPFRFVVKNVSTRSQAIRPACAIVLIYLDILPG